jgi:hypothetical protein
VWVGSGSNVFFFILMVDGEGEQSILTSSIISSSNDTQPIVHPYPSHLSSSTTKLEKEEEDVVCLCPIWLGIVCSKWGGIIAVAITP